MVLTQSTFKQGWCTLTIGLLIAGLALGGTARADTRRRPPPAFHEGSRVNRPLPPGRHTLRPGPPPGDYRQRIYHRPDRRGYRVAGPPRGTVVYHLHRGYEILLVAGITYFLLSGVFYQRVPDGYMVVDPPPGFAYPQAVAPPMIGEVVAVAVYTLNVRSGPGLEYPVIDLVRSGNRLLVEGIAPGWYFVRLPNGTTGWVMARFTQPLGWQTPG